MCLCILNDFIHRRKIIVYFQRSRFFPGPFSLQYLCLSQKQHQLLNSSGNFDVRKSRQIKTVNRMAGWYHGQVDTLNSWWVQWDLRADLSKQVVRLNRSRGFLLRPVFPISRLFFSLFYWKQTTSSSPGSWRQIYNENLYAEKNDNHQVWPRQDPRLTCKNSAAGIWLGMTQTPP